MHLTESQELEQQEFQYNFNSSQFHSIGRFGRKTREYFVEAEFFPYIAHSLCTFRPFLPAPDAPV